MSAVKNEWQCVWNWPIEDMRKKLAYLINTIDHSLYVGQGIGGPNGKWATYRRKPNGSSRRVVSKFLPPRDTKEEAERDLYVWLWFV